MMNLLMLLMVDGLWCEIMVFTISVRWCRHQASLWTTTPSFRQYLVIMMIMIIWPDFNGTFILSWWKELSETAKIDISTIKTSYNPRKLAGDSGWQVHWLLFIVNNKYLVKSNWHVCGQIVPLYVCTIRTPLHCHLQSKESNWMTFENFLQFDDFVCDNSDTKVETIHTLYMQIWRLNSVL